MPSGANQPAAEAGRFTTRRRLMPTGLSSAELRQIDAEILQASLFSARNVYTDVLGVTRDAVASIINPGAERRIIDGVERDVTVGFNPAKARVAIADALKRVGYAPEADKKGSLQDLSSFARLDLVVNTQTEMAQGYGWWRQGQQPQVLDEFPASELFRAEDRKVPRDDGPLGWVKRFQIAGNASNQPGWTIADGRMVALKNHPIWELLGSAELFSDGLGNPWPPFAFNSGMDVRDVSRDEAMQLGLIDRDTQIQPQERSFLAA